MTLLGQASGGWTESSSALRLLHVAIRNTTAIATDDSFTQTNPPGVTVTSTVSTRINQRKFGVLSGSVAFTRPDAGSNYVGGPGLAATQNTIRQAIAQAIGYRAVGCFINSATGNPYENLPAQASGICPYVSGMGTYGNRTYETALLNTVGAMAQGAALTYANGLPLMASLNGYLMPSVAVISGAATSLDTNDGGNPPVCNAAESYVRGVNAGVATNMGVVKMPPDATQTEIVYDQRV